MDNQIFSDKRFVFNIPLESVYEKGELCDFNLNPVIWSVARATRRYVLCMNGGAQHGKRARGLSFAARCAPGASVHTRYTCTIRYRHIIPFHMII